MIYIPLFFCNKKESGTKV